MRFKHLCLAVGGVSVLLTGQAFAQSAASCRKAEFKGGSPVFYYDKACMAKLKSATKPVKEKAVAAKTSRKSSRKVRSVQKLLAAKGYKPGVADGVMGSNTRKAIGQYYKKHGLKGSKMNAVLAHLKSSPKKSKAAAKRAARVAAIKKAVAAKRAAAKKASSSASSNAKKTAASKPKTGSKGLTLYQRQQAQAAKSTTAKSTSSGVSSAQKSANARAAKVAAIKKAVAAKRAAAAKTKAAAAKPSFMQRMKNKIKTAVSGKKSKTAGASDAQKAAKARAAKVAAIKKAVAAKRAAAKTKAVAKKKVAAKAPSAAKSDKNIADLQSLLAAKGKYAGKVDGTMNIETRKSVISYYHANKLDVGKGTIAQAVHKDLKSGGAKKAVVAAKVSAKPAAAKKASSEPSLYERQQALAAKSKVAASAPKVATKKKVAAKASPAAKGDKNIADLQSLLAAKGKYAGKVDGTMNIETRKSVINYYHANKLDVGKGTIAQAVHKDLKSGGAKKTVAAATAPAAKAKPKLSGNKIIDIQTMLGKKGLYAGKSDGLLNAPTRKSILGYYKKHKLKRNGGTIIDTVHAHLTGGTV